MQIKNLIFDLGGVILEDHFTPAAKIIHQKHNLDPEVLYKALKAAENPDYHQGKISYLEHWRNILDTLQLPQDLAPDIISSYEDVFVPVPDMIEYVESLKDRYKLYMLSNQVEAVLPNLKKKYEFFGWFTDEIYSFEVGMSKPHTDIYEYLLQKTGITPNESVFIDNQKENLGPAKNLGIHIVLFKNKKQLEEDLKKITS